MPLSVLIMVSSGMLLTAFFLLFKAERINQRYSFFLEKRTHLDSVLDQKFKKLERVKVLFGASSFRLFFHYVLHQFLGGVLFMINWIETRLHGLRKKNRVIAKSVENAKNDNHLSHIARHKETTALSPEERETRKEKSLND